MLLPAARQAPLAIIFLGRDAQRDTLAFLTRAPPEAQAAPRRIPCARAGYAGQKTGFSTFMVGWSWHPDRARQLFTVSEGASRSVRPAADQSSRNFKPGFTAAFLWSTRLTKFDGRILTDVYHAEHFLTREQEQLTIDFDVKWRIENLRRYSRTTGGSQDVANARSERDHPRESVRTVVTQRTRHRWSPRSAPSSPMP